MIRKDYIELAKLVGYKCVGKESPRTKHEKTDWVCDKGHEVKVSFSSLQTAYRKRGKGQCNQCSSIEKAKRQNKLEKDYHALAQERGMRWTGKELPATTTYHKTSWRCSKKHKWVTTYSLIQQGRSCRKCWNNRLRVTLKDYHKAGKKAGLKYLEKTIAKNGATHGNWECLKCGHIKFATYNTVSVGGGCPKCYDRRRGATVRLTEKDYQKIANKVKLEWVGEELPRRVDQKTNWKCKKCKYVHAASQITIRNGAGCIKCGGFVNGVKASKPQIAIAKLLGAKVNYKIGRRTVDAALVSSKIAIEYDSYYYHGDRTQRDKLRNKEILDAGWSLLRIRSNQRIPEPRRLDYAIQKIKEGRKHYRMTLKDWGVGVKRS